MCLSPRTFCVVLFLLPTLVWGGAFSQRGITLQHYLEENPGQQPLVDQLSVRVHSIASPITAIQTNTLQVGVIFSGPESDIANRAWLTAFKRRMQILRIDYRLDVFYLPNQHAAHDVIRVFNAIQHSKFDYLIVNSISGYLRPGLERILKQGTPEIIMSQVSTPLHVWRFHPPLTYIGVDPSQSMAQLASYLDRRLSTNAAIDVIAVDGAYLYGNLCTAFINALESLGRSVRGYYIVADTQEEGYRAAMALSDSAIGKPPVSTEQFIFSCTPNISLGVWRALNDMGLPQTFTNSWSGKPPYMGNANQHLLVTVLGMHDSKAIAASEIIKAHMESRLLPGVYGERSQLITQDMDEQTLNIMYEQAFIYSRPLWPH